MKRFILFAFVFALGCHVNKHIHAFPGWHGMHGRQSRQWLTSCPTGQKLTNGACCGKLQFYDRYLSRCNDCGCNEFGAKGGKKGECDDNGDCYCHDHFIGYACDYCEFNYYMSNGRCCKKDEYYALWANKCRYCRCNEIGAKGGKKGRCNEKGDCYCYSDYTDGECGSCVAGLKMSNGHCCNPDHYYSTSRRKCRYCKCEEPGSIGGKKGGCDGNGECYCFRGYEGYECQRCKPGYKDTNGYCCKKDHYLHKVYGCLPCRCEEPGSKGGKKGECDSYGWCYCHPGYKGSECQECKKDYKMSNGHCCELDHYYNKGSKKCKYCRCEEIGTKGGKKGQCDGRGQCDCYKDYTGEECQKCIKGQKMSNGHCCKLDHFYNVPKRKCADCICDYYGAKGGGSGQCDGIGRCYCYEGYKGYECQICKPGYIRSSQRCCKNYHYYDQYKKRCIPCKCEKFGAKGGDKGNCNYRGQCHCYSGHTGLKCQHCKPSHIRVGGFCCKRAHYFNKDKKKCIHCNCDDDGAKGGKKGECNGKGQCFCWSDYAGLQCQRCAPGARYYRKSCRIDYSSG